MKPNSFPRHKCSNSLVCDHWIFRFVLRTRTDFRGEPFEGSKYLLAWAETLVEIKTVCSTGRKATMNARIGADGERETEGAQLDIGHHYVAMSRKEFRLDQVSPIGYQPPQELHWEHLTSDEQ